MIRGLLTIASIATLAGLMTLPVGCGGAFGGSFDFFRQMSCPGTPVESAGDLSFLQLNVAFTTDPIIPGDTAVLSGSILNSGDIADGSAANISLPSNLRFFLSLDRTLDPNDVLFGDVPVSGIPAGQSVVFQQSVTIPRVSNPGEPELFPTNATQWTGNFSLTQDGNGDDVYLFDNLNFDATANLKTYDWVLINGRLLEVQGVFPDPVNISPVPFNGTSAFITVSPLSDQNVNGVNIQRTSSPKFFPYVIPPSSIGLDYDPRNPDRPEFIGPTGIAYWAIAVLDPQNCVFEEGEPQTPEYERYDEPAGEVVGRFGNDYDAGDANLNNQAIVNGNSSQTTGQLNAAFSSMTVITNPNLPNLKIRFLDRQPASDIPQRGTVINMRWEILNEGLAPVTETIGVNIRWSENELVETWDAWVNDHLTAELIGDNGILPGPTTYAPGIDNPITTDIPGKRNITEPLRARLPYGVIRTNAYQGQSSAVYEWQAGPIPAVPRDPPPAGPPSFPFTVYCPIPTQGNTANFLIAEVDRADTIREASEFDNQSSLIQNGNGSVGVVKDDPSTSVNWEALSLLANYSQLSGRVEIDLTYASNSSDGQVSIAWHLSEDDEPQSADYFWNRFWYLRTQGNNVLFSDALAMNVDLPTTGRWWVVAVIDDNFKFRESEEGDNFAISNGSTIIR